MAFDSIKLGANGWLRPLVMILLLGTTAWTFWGALKSPFHFDDALFLQSTQVTNPGDPWFLLKPTQTRQLTYLTFYWNYRLGGRSPAGYHAANLVLHLLCVLALYWLARLLIRRYPRFIPAQLHRWLPVSAAGVFALHPVQSEAVNYVYQRSVILAALFILLSLGSYLQAQESPHKRIWLGFSGACFLLAVASKESALILPAAYLALIWADARDSRSVLRQLMKSRWLMACFVISLLGSALFLYTLWHQNESTVGLTLIEDSFRYFIFQFQALAKYLRLLLLPIGLSVDHDFHPAPLISLYSLACVALILSIVMLIIRLRRSNPAFSLLSTWFLIFLIPTSSLIPSKDLVCEHRLYIPMFAAAILISSAVLTGLHRLAAAHGRKWLLPGAAFCLLLAGYSVMSQGRTYVWGDGVRLWKDAAEKAPMKARTHYNLAVAYLERDREQAKREFLETIRLDPRHAVALYNLGWLAQSERDYETARKYYRAAIQADANTWQAYQNLGNIDVLQGNVRDARREFEEAILRQKDYWPAYMNLAALQAQAGEIPAALATLESALKYGGNVLELRYLNAYVLVLAGRFTEARSELQFITGKDSGGVFRNRISGLLDRMRQSSKISK